MTTVIVGGALGNRPNNGGGAWVRLSWARGLRKLGFRVFLVEQIARDACVDEAGAIVPLEESVNLAFFRRATEQFGLDDSAVLIRDDGARTSGPTYGEVLDLAAEADLLVNISGHLTLRPFKQRVRRTVFLDIDPGFTQFWHAAGDPGAHLDGHDLYFTIGENIGAAGCSIPTGGIAWRTTRQPVVLEDWPVRGGDFDRFTTVARWRGPYGPITVDGRTLGQKVHEFRTIAALPERARQPFEIALDIHPADERDAIMLRAHGWRLVDPRQAAADPAAFRSYVQGSGAEFSVAQGVYVHTNSGWFSDRTVRYLASGKPALVQQTGFDRSLPVGEGLLSFRTLEEAVAGAREIARNFARHRRAARSLAEEYFDADRVLSRFVEEVGVAP